MMKGLNIINITRSKNKLQSLIGIKEFFSLNKLLFKLAGKKYVLKNFNSFMMSISFYLRMTICLRQWFIHKKILSATLQILIWYMKRYFIGKKSLELWNIYGFTNVASVFKAFLLDGWKNYSFSLIVLYIQLSRNMLKSPLKHVFFK